MRRATLGMLRESSLGKAVGLCAANLSEIAAIVNEAQERLMMDPMCPDEGWWGMWGTMAFTVSVTNAPGGYGYITAPHDVARVIVLDVCRVPVKMRNGFYEYLDFGSGLQPETCRNVGCGAVAQAYDRDSVCTLADLLPTAQYIRLYPQDSNDVGKRVTVQGEDQNRQIVLGTDTETEQAILGELIYLNLPFVTTLNQFSKLTGFLKDYTLAPVSIYQVDPSTGAEVVLSSMAPNEVTAYYRKYLINGLPAKCCDTSDPNVTVTCQVRFDFVPVQSDTDYLLIQNIPALIEECQSIRYGRQDTGASDKLSDKHHLKAVTLLCGQLDTYLGKTKTAIGVPIFGSDPLKRQPV